MSNWRGPLSTTQSDGASVMTLAQHGLFDSPFLGSPDSGAAQADADAAPSPAGSTPDPSRKPRVSSVLVGLPLFPQYCGQGPREDVNDGLPAAEPAGVLCRDLRWLVHYMKAYVLPHGTWQPLFFANRA